MKLIQRLDRRRFAPLVLLHRDGGQLAALLRDEGVEYEMAPTADYIGHSAGASRSRQALAFPRLALALAHFLRRRRIGIVHTNDGAMHATWALPTRLAGAKLLWHHRGSPDARALRWLAPWLAHRVVAVSDFAAPRPGLVSAADKCRVIHSPFDTGARPDAPLPRAATLAQLGLPGDARVIGYFGIMTDRKRPLVFVETLAALRDRNPAAPVVGLMFGDVVDPGLDAAVLARARALGIEDRLRLMGYRTPSAPWMTLCDLLLVTAVDEPFGRTLIEAMLLGTPVVAAASGGNVEAIADGVTGLLVPPDRPDAFADAVLALLDDPARAAALAAAAGTDARRRYGIGAHVGAITDIYRQLAA
ncbi:glycosyltransferase family 4 protein [Sandarakinorhabdus sp. DWP1-3-1]|uniref:glycosyltransferase family 4 protein n=1 Tax=Sandarakinorhabdus sp. DWP1-3-1 TaxID=2804627 RepID=UPI003CEEF8C3